VNLPGSGSQACTGQAAPIKLGLPILDIAGPAANSVFNIPSPQDQQNDWTAIVAYINQQHGLLCHPLVADFQSMNPADNTSGHTACLQFVQDHVFAVLGYLSANATPGTGGDLCVVQNHIPMFHPQAVPADVAAQNYPYLFGMERTDVLYRNFVFGAKQIGEFSPSHGFAKLGIVYKDCEPALNQYLLQQLQLAGLTSAQIDKADLSCPNGYATPDVLAQAVLNFQRDGVTTVTFDEPGDPDLPNFTRAAGEWHPQYLMPDNGLLLDTNQNTQGPDPNNFNGAIAITPNQYGALTSNPPLAVSPRTAECDQALSKAGLATAEQSVGGTAGIDCDLMWLFMAAASHAPALSQDQLGAGLQAARSVQLSYPGGPNDTTAPHTTMGGQYWRVTRFDGSCDCWRVVDATFHPSF
jgi:hypothetical protein